MYRAIRKHQLSPGEGNAAVNALRGFVQSLEAERGHTLNLNHSGAIGVTVADRVFSDVFGSSPETPLGVPDSMAEGPEPVQDMAQG